MGESALPAGPDESSMPTSVLLADRTRRLAECFAAYEGLRDLVEAYAAERAAAGDARVAADLRAILAGVR